MPKPVEYRTYQPDSVVAFRKTNERFGGLSNMAPGFPLQINDQFVRTSEALYQACRYPHLPEVQKLILTQSSPMTAKMYARKYLQQSRPDWESVRLAVMRWCLRAKLLQNQTTFGELLLATGQLPIVEYSAKDDFWGAKQNADGDLVGRNVLGRLLMELRENYRLNELNLLSLAPLNIRCFALLGEPIAELKLQEQHQQQMFIAESW